MPTTGAFCAGVGHKSRTCSMAAVAPAGGVQTNQQLQQVQWAGGGGMQQMYSLPGQPGGMPQMYAPQQPGGVQQYVMPAPAGTVGAVPPPVPGAAPDAAGLSCAPLSWNIPPGSSVPPAGGLPVGALPGAPGATTAPTDPAQMASQAGSLPPGLPQFTVPSQLPGMPGAPADSTAVGQAAAAAVGIAAGDAEVKAEAPAGDGGAAGGAE